MDVRIEDVAVRFGAVEALRGVDLTLGPGRTTVMVGPNGAGKSTLMGVLLGLIRPDEGRVLANGQTVATPRSTASREFRARLGYLPEAPAFSENLTGRQVLRFFARARGVDADRIEATLKRVGLSHAAGRAVRGYSRGMRQRLGLGVAVLAAPDLLILDEPTGGLDQEGLGVLWEVLEEWKQAGRAVLLSTHEVALIERHADEVCVLSQGAVRAIGTPNELRTAARLPVRVRLHAGDAGAARALADDLAPRLSGRIEVIGDHVGVRVAPDDLLSVMHAVDRRRVRDVRVDEPGLDEVYQQILGGVPWDASRVH